MTGRFGGAAFALVSAEGVPPARAAVDQAFARHGFAAPTTFVVTCQPARRGLTAAWAARGPLIVDSLRGLTISQPIGVDIGGAVS